MKSLPPSHGFHRISTGTRRDFLRWTGGLGLAATAHLAGLAPTWAFDEKPKASTLITGKDPRLMVLEPFPAVLETPLELLMNSRVTPVDLLFVRNNQQPKEAATLEPVPLKGWKIEVSGLIDKPFTLDAAELEEMESVTHEMVLQCSGNSRSLFSLASQTKGTQWGRGGMGNIAFSGIPLSTILEKKQVKIDPSARYILIQGKDGPVAEGKEDFEHSTPIDDMLSRAMLALSINGQPLPAIHGGPVRLVIPGVYGTMQMKWLSGLKFEKEESTNYNHIPRYRTPNTPIKPGESIEYTLQNSSFNWDMKVKSVVLSPTTDAQVQAGKVTVKGVAFNDGKAPIETVLVSFNQGESWQKAKLSLPKDLYAWTGFELSTMLKPGRHSIWTRAVDALGRSQPLEGAIHWNPSGYEWNGVEKIDFTVQ